MNQLKLILVLAIDVRVVDLYETTRNTRKIFYLGDARQKRPALQFYNLLFKNCFQGMIAKSWNVSFIRLDQTQQQIIL